jgi:dCTP diphosphatase
MSDSFLTSLQLRLQDFARERDWEQFHTRKNLAMALTVEAGELQEIFQWLSAEQSAALDTRQQQQVEEELADVLLYLCRLADVLNVDLEQAALAKLARNAERYPAAKVYGKADKYRDH